MMYFIAGPHGERSPCSNQELERLWRELSRERNRPYPDGNRLWHLNSQINELTDRLRERNRK